MSIRLTPIDFTGAAVGTTGNVDWSQVTGQSTNPAHTGDDAAHLVLYNDSPCELLLDLVTGDTDVLPSGGWRNYPLDPSCTSFRFIVDAVLAGALVAKLYMVWYAPRETVPQIVTLGNSPIGGSVSTSIANAIRGIGDVYFITEDDSSGIPLLVPIAPTSAEQIGMALGVRAGGNNVYVLSVLSPSLETVVAAKLHVVGNEQIDGVISQIQGFPLTGALGVPGITDIVQDVHVTATTLQTILSYTTSVAWAPMFRVRCNVVLNNSVSGNNITIKLAYTDVQNVARTLFLPLSRLDAAGSVFPNGANSAVNGIWTTETVDISARAAAGSVVLSYQDPTNVPNDYIHASFELMN